MYTFYLFQEVPAIDRPAGLGCVRVCVRVRAHIYTHTLIPLQSSEALCIIQYSPRSHALDSYGLQSVSKATYFGAQLQDQKSWGNWCFKTTLLR